MFDRGLGHLAQPPSQQDMGVFTAGLQGLCLDINCWYCQCQAGSQQDSFVNMGDCFLPLTGFSSLFYVICCKIGATALEQEWYTHAHPCVQNPGLPLRCESGSLAEVTVGQGLGVQPESEPKSSALEQTCELNGTGRV